MLRAAILAAVFAAPAHAQNETDCRRAVKGYVAATATIRAMMGAIEAALQAGPMLPADQGRALLDATDAALDATKQRQDVQSGLDALLRLCTPR